MQLPSHIIGYSSSTKVLACEGTAYLSCSVYFISFHAYGGVRLDQHLRTADKSTLYLPRSQGCPQLLLCKKPKKVQRHFLNRTHLFVFRTNLFKLPAVKEGCTRRSSEIAWMVSSLASSSEKYGPEEDELRLECIPDSQVCV